jgi:hypothetical protein
MELDPDMTRNLIDNLISGLSNEDPHSSITDSSAAFN